VRVRVPVARREVSNRRVDDRRGRLGVGRVYAELERERVRDRRAIPLAVGNANTYALNAKYEARLKATCETYHTCVHYKKTCVLYGHV
jgi:hypothetical protein